MTILDLPLAIDIARSVCMITCHEKTKKCGFIDEKWKGA